MINDFAGYVLAGGKSSRMGTDKALLEIGGQTLLERAVSTLSPNCGNRVKAVINEAQRDSFETRFSNLNFVTDLYGERGALGGIHAALENCESEWTLILACDLPLVTPEALLVLTKIAVTENFAAAIVPRQSDGRLQPLCAAYRRKACLPKIENIMRERESASMRDFLDLIRVKFVPQIELSPDERLFLNVNRPEDFASITGI